MASPRRRPCGPRPGCWRAKGTTAGWASRWGRMAWLSVASCSVQSPARAGARVREGEGDHGGVGEQVGADGLAERGELLGPVTGQVGVQVQACVDLVDEPVDQGGLA